MKTIFLNLSIAVLILTISCHTKNSIPPPGTSGTLMFHVHTNVDTNEVGNFNSPYTLNYGTNAGRKISVSQAQLLISNIKLVGSDGNVYNVPGRIIHMVQPYEVYLVGSVPVGNFQSVSYTVGLDPTSNSIVPTVSDTALNDASLWYSGPGSSSSVPAGGGYIFVDFEGMIDTSKNKTGHMAQFVYKLGTNSNAVSVSMPKDTFSIIPNQTTFVHMIINYAALIDNLDVTQKSNLMINTVSDNSSALANTLKNNISPSGGAKGQSQLFVSYEP